jgi:hypothetical protein
MNDYFDALERELAAAVPRAARSHRRRLPLFRLNSLWMLLLIPLALVLAPAVGGDGFHARAAPHLRAASPALNHNQTRHRRPPRQPNEFTLLNGLAALRRRATATVADAQSLGSRVRAVAPLPTAVLLRFAAATTVLGLRAVLVVRRRDEARSSPPPNALPLLLLDPQRCGTRRHRAAPARRAAQGTITCPHAATGCDYTRLVTRSGLSRRRISSA